MSTRKKITAFLAGALISVGLAAGLVQPAHAVVLNGLCVATPYDDCARQSGGYFDNWARDISGDSNQQMSRSYQGQVSNSGCWPFTCGTGNNASLDGKSVYKIYNIHTGQCLAASSIADGGLIHAQSCSANGTNWVWNGSTGNANLINVYQTNNAAGHYWQMLARDSLYSILYTGSSPWSWGLVSVIG
jgi:hypothetical protein